jgi:large subunit ribosomal protein L25
MRRQGLVPGVVYGGGDDAVPFAVDARTLRNALAHSGAVIDLVIDDGSGTPVILKETQRHPVRGEVMHVDLLRVRLDQTIQSVVALELIGGDDAPGVREGGVLDQVTRELHVEALPGDLPESIVYDVSGMEMNETRTLAAVTPPSGVTLLDDPDETVIASLMSPTAEPTEEEIEQETGVVGEDGAAAQEQAEGATQDEADASSDSE